jgi:uncharacterized membrane protein
MSRKQIDFLVIVGILIAAAWASILFHLKPLTGSFFYLVLPSIYLMLRKRKNYRKIFWSVVILGLILGFTFDFLAEFNGAWRVTSLVIPYRVFGVEPVDNVLGYVIMVLFMVTFYEHFIDDERNRRISKKASQLFLMVVVATILLVAAYLGNRTTLEISHMYLKAGLTILLLFIIYAFRHPKMLVKFSMLAFFFFPVWLVAEVVVLKNGGWYFAQQYIGWVTIFGVTFPFEELFFWMMCYAVTMIAFYEHFIDDEK